MLTLGWKASAEQFGPQELLDYGVMAEQHGFDSIVVSDHFHPWKDTDGPAPFSFTGLGAMGARTTRAKLGTSVVTPTFRYHPAIVAQAFATLGVLFPGRVFLGVGSGESMNETPVTGHEWPPPGERLHRLGEAVELSKEPWADDYVTVGRARTAGRGQGRGRGSARDGAPRRGRGGRGVQAIHRDRRSG